MLSPSPSEAILRLSGWSLLLAGGVVPLCLVLIGLSLAYYGLSDGVRGALGLALTKLLLQPALVLLSSSAQRRSGMEREDLFAACLAKPVKHSQLFTTLGQVLQMQRLSSSPAEGPRRLDPTLARRLPLRILVVEDSAINQKLAVGILAKLGYPSDVAGNGREALELVRRQPYDLVFMDLQMPEMDGLEATRRIVAEQSALVRPRIVAMTAHAMDGDRDKCLAAGMDEHLPKPFTRDQLQATLQRWLPAPTPA